MKDVNQSSATSREKLAPRKKFEVLHMCPHDHTCLCQTQWLHGDSRHGHGAESLHMLQGHALSRAAASAVPNKGAQTCTSYLIDVNDNIGHCQWKTADHAPGPHAPDEALFGVAICKGKPQRPVADAADELVDDVVQQDVPHILRTHAARLRAGHPSK